jgi:hypothetical protein
MIPCISATFFMHREHYEFQWLTDGIVITPQYVRTHFQLYETSHQIFYG